MGQPSENFAAARTCCASSLFLFVRPKSGCYCQGSLSRPCFDHFFRPCFRGHDEAGLLAFSMSLFSDVGPLEAIAENKT